MDRFEGDDTEDRMVEFFTVLPPVALVKYYDDYTPLGIGTGMTAELPRAVRRLRRRMPQSPRARLLAISVELGPVGYLLVWAREIRAGRGSLEVFENSEEGRTPRRFGGRARVRVPGALRQSWSSITSTARCSSSGSASFSRRSSRCGLNSRHRSMARQVDGATAAASPCSRARSMNLRERGDNAFVLTIWIAGRAL